MEEQIGRKGRPRKYKVYDDLVASCKDSAMRRPRYYNGIGVRRGEKGYTLWIKIQINKKPVTWKGRVYNPGQAIEHKLGPLASFTWEQAEGIRNTLQGRTDRGEPLEDKQAFTFKAWAEDWLERKKGSIANWQHDEKAFLAKVRRCADG